MAFGSEQWMYSAGGFYPYAIDNSVRFDTNAYLTRTPSVASNRKTFTWSSWVKRGNVGTETDTIFLQRLDSNNSDQFAIQFKSDNTLRVIDQTASGGQTLLLDTTAVFRDPSAWYHITVSIDTTNSTAGDRARLYVNGERITAFTTESTWPLNHNTSVNSTVRALIGANRGNSSPTLKNFFNGYLAEVNFVDGQALDPTDFGEFKSGVWIPKEYSGTYGTNGFYLDFGNSGSLGADVSGNGNNWTPTNLATTDQMLDSPTNNFATLNPVSGISTNPAYSEGNLKFVNAAGAYAWGYSTIPLPKTGKWVFEVLFQASALDVSPWVYNSAGVTTNPQLATYATGSTTTYLINDHGGSGGQVFVEAGVEQGSHNGLTAGTVVQVQVDCDNNEMTFNLNGTQQTQAGSTVDIPSDVTLYPITGEWGNQTFVNFGQDSSFAGNKTAQGNTDANGRGDFYYAPPAGYLALCSANLPDTAIDPNRDDIPTDYFNPALYTGNGTGQSITGVGFQPDFVWIKSRSDVDNNVLQDVVRGVTKQLFSNLADVETSFTNGVTSFDSDGFTVATSNWSNENGQTRVAWNWKAGGTAVANTDGTIASQVSANTKAGFSIVTYTGDGNNATVGHGLSAEPELMIFKNRTSSGNSWVVYSSELGASQYLLLDGSGAAGTYNHFQNTAPTSSVAYITGGATSINVSSNDYVCYAFHSVEGFSKFGNYTGNGSTDGPFIYTGFRPAYVMVKRTSDTGNWLVQNNKALGYNPSNSELYANLANAEATADRCDFLSNGFKPRINSTENNASGSTYIYMAFAEMPFKYANAR